MPHSIRRVRAARWPAAVLLLGFALPALSACGSGRADSSPGSGHAAAAPVRPAAVTYAMPADVTDLVLPVTGAGSRWAQGLDALARQAADKAARQCVAAHHTTMPAQPPVTFIRYSAIPDLDSIARHGFDGGPVPGTGTASYAAGAEQAGSGPDAAQRACLARGAGVGNDFRKTYLPLQAKWWQELSSLNSAPSVKSAFGAFSRCLAGHKVPAKDESTFFDLVDRRQQAGDTGGAQALSATYATCMKPVEDTRGPLRTRLRDGFRKRHGEELEQLRTTLPDRIRDLERRYGLRVSFPAP